GELGRSGAQMKRIVTPDAPIEIKIANLRNLHPAADRPFTMPPPPAKPIYNNSNVTMELFKKVTKRSRKGAAPGPLGITSELMHVWLSDPTAAHEIHAMLIDCLNGNVPESLRDAVTMAFVIGIPKQPAGTRPIALPDAYWNIVEATQLQVDVNKKPLKQDFRNKQYATGRRDGANVIIHSFRSTLRTGIAINHLGETIDLGKDAVGETIDCRNAFNAPDRQALSNEVARYPGLIDTFRVAYGNNPRLVVVGSNRDNPEIIMSERGGKQGQVRSGVDFSLLVLKAQNAALAANPKGIAMAFMDDLPLAAENVEGLKKMSTAVIEVMTAAQVSINYNKCELISRKPVSIEATSVLAQFDQKEVVKILGASIGYTDENERRHLYERMHKKFDEPFRRYMITPPSPQMFNTLRSTLSQSLSHAVRVHSPAVVGPIAAEFTKRVEDIIARWGSFEMTEKQRIILHAPASAGGFGFPDWSLIAPAAYAAAVASAKAPEDGKSHVRQDVLTEVIMSEVLAKAYEKYPGLKEHMLNNSLPGVADAWRCTEQIVNEDVFGAALRTFLMADTVAASKFQQLTCPGCHRNLPLDRCGEHFGSCPNAQYGLITRRHNCVAASLRRLIRMKGFCDDDEPRDLRWYTCAGCKAEMMDDEFRVHRTTCPNSKSTPLHSSGPDLRYIINSCATTFVGDITVRNPNVASHANETVAEMYARATAEKEAKYGALCAKAGVVLITLNFTTTGSYAPEVTTLVKICCESAIKQPKKELARISAQIVYTTAAARLSVEKRLQIAPPTLCMHALEMVKKLKSSIQQLPDGNDGLPLPMPAAAPEASQQQPQPALTIDQLIELAVRKATANFITLDSIPGIITEAIQLTRARVKEEEAAERVELGLPPKPEKEHQRDDGEEQDYNDNENLDVEFENNNNDDNNNEGGGASSAAPSAATARAASASRNSNNNDNNNNNRKNTLLSSTPTRSLADEDLMRAQAHAINNANAILTEAQRTAEKMQQTERNMREQRAREKSAATAHLAKLGHDITESEKQKRISDANAQVIANARVTAEAAIVAARDHLTQAATEIKQEQEKIDIAVADATKRADQARASARKAQAAETAQRSELREAHREQLEQQRRTQDEYDRLQREHDEIMRGRERERQRVAADIRRAEAAANRHRAKLFDEETRRKRAMAEYGTPSAATFFTPAPDPVYPGYTTSASSNFNNNNNNNNENFGFGCFNASSSSSTCSSNNNNNGGQHQHQQQQAQQPILRRDPAATPYYPHMQDQKPPRAYAYLGQPARDADDRDATPKMESVRQREQQQQQQRQRTSSSTNDARNSNGNNSSSGASNNAARAATHHDRDVVSDCSNTLNDSTNAGNVPIYGGNRSNPCSPPPKRPVRGSGRQCSNNAPSSSSSSSSTSSSSSSSSVRRDSNNINSRRSTPAGHGTTDNAATPPLHRHHQQQTRNSSSQYNERGTPAV
ncbi:hypothetical protein EPO17_03655, partial [Patescibacteria group bacterium]